LQNTLVLQDAACNDECFQSILSQNRAQLASSLFLTSKLPANPKSNIKRKVLTALWRVEASTNHGRLRGSFRIWMPTTRGQWLSPPLLASDYSINANPNRPATYIVGSVSRSLLGASRLEP